MFNPHSEDWLKNKFKYYELIRNNNSLYFSEKYNSYIITRFVDVQSSLLNTEIFSSARGNLVVESPHRFGKTLGASDDPVHSMYKSIVKEAYSKENISRIVENSVAVLDFGNSNQINISNIIKKLSATVTCDILNLPVDRNSLINLIMQIQQYSPKTVLVNPNPIYDAQLNKILDALMISKKESNGPGIYQEVLKNNGEAVRSLFTGPTISGASSMTGALEFLTLDLYREGQLEMLLNNLHLIPEAVNESIRFNSSTGRFSRTVTTDVIIQGTHLKEGDRVILCLDAANRDPFHFTDVNSFYLNRKEQNLGFGYGPHACIALAISKAVMIAYLQKLLSSFGKYKVLSEGSYLLSASGNNDMIDDIIIEKVR